VITISYFFSFCLPFHPHNKCLCLSFYHNYIISQRHFYFLFHIFVFYPCEPFLSTYGWLCMIITLFLYPTNERSTLEKVSLSLTFFFHNFILIHWIFIWAYIEFYINIHEHIFLFAFGFSLSVLCFAYYVLFCFTWQKFFIARELYGLFYFVLNSVHEGETLYARLVSYIGGRSSFEVILFHIRHFSRTRNFFHNGIINWLQFTEISWCRDFITILQFIYICHIKVVVCSAQKYLNIFKWGRTIYELTFDDTIRDKENKNVVIPLRNITKKITSFL
jgi:hypothetical protein